MFRNVYGASGTCRCRIYGDEGAIGLNPALLCGGCTCLGSSDSFAPCQNAYSV